MAVMLTSDGERSDSVDVSSADRVSVVDSPADPRVPTPDSHLAQVRAAASDDVVASDDPRDIDGSSYGDGSGYFVRTVVVPVVLLVAALVILGIAAYLIVGMV